MSSRFELTRQEFSAAIAHHIEGMRLTIMNVLEEAGIESSDVDEVLMVGGSSRVPIVNEMVTTFFGRQPNSGIHPDEAVARGAALFASQMMAALNGVVIAPEVRDLAKRLPSVRDIVPHSLGTTAVWEDDREHNSIILPRGAKIDAPVRQTFRTISDGQTVVRIDVNEGEGDDLDYVQVIGGFDLILPEPRPAGSPIDVEIVLDKGGIIRVTAIDLKSGQRKSVTIDYNSNLKPEQVEARKTWLRGQSVT
jgi:molecular chaperone DnaK